MPPAGFMPTMRPVSSWTSRIASSMQSVTGSVGYLTQALGGSFTVYIEGNLFRIAGVDGDAIGKESLAPPDLAEALRRDAEWIDAGDMSIASLLVCSQLPDALRVHIACGIREFANPDAGFKLAGVG